MAHITIKDIARELKISPSTVSRALRGHPDISAKTKLKVLAVAKEINYQPDLIAQSLKAKSTKTVGIIVPEIKHYFFSSAISGIEDTAHRAGYSILLSQSNETYEREILNLNTLVSNRVAGLLVSLSQETDQVDHFKRVMKNGIPVVFFDRVCSDPECWSIECDDYQGAFMAVEHLIQRGYRRIAHIAGHSFLSIGRTRFQGYKDALNKHGIKFDPALVRYGGLNEADGTRGLLSLINDGSMPDAVFAVNDPVAIGIFSTMKERGLRIPDDMALIGFSDNPIVSLIDPPLTTIRQPAHQMGVRAMELLMDQLEDEEKDNNVKHIKLLTELVIRKST